MSQGNDFANYGSAAADKPAEEDGLWYVAIASDDIKTMTLDQLDDAFRLGVITAETSVWTEGMEAWAPLREVAGLEDGDGSSSDSLENEETVARGQSAPAGFGASYAPPANSGVHSTAGHGGGGHSGGFQSPFGAVVESSNQGAGSLSPFGLSTAPVALNVDEDMPPMRSARRWRPERWGIGAVAVLGLGIALYTGLFSSSAASEQPVSAAAAAPQVTGLALNAKQADPAMDDEDEAPASKPSAAEAQKQVAAADDDADDEKAEASKPELDAKKLAGAAAAVPAAAALKGNVADALRSNKKGASRQASILKRKPAKKARATSKAKRASASKSIGGPSKGGSAFDPLNDSLP